MANRSQYGTLFFVTLSPCHLVTLSLLLAGCDFPGRPRPVAETKVTDFEAIFGQNCAGCHGAEGKLGGAPPLNDPLFRAIMPEKELEEVIKRGRRGTPMPAFAQENGGALNATQIQVLVNEIKGFPYEIEEKQEGNTTKVQVVRTPQGDEPRWGQPEQPPPDVPPYSLAEGGNQEAGAQVFARACAVCHGRQGEGTQETGPLHDPTFLALISPQALRRFAITGRPDLGMPNYAEPRPGQEHFQPLTAQDVTNLVAFLTSWKPQEQAPGKAQGP